MKRFHRFFSELNRRRVFRVMAMYAATAFIILEAGDIILPRIGLHDWTVTVLIVILAIGFPITAIISWIFDITPEGIIRTTPEQQGAKNDLVQRPGKGIFNLNNLIILILFAVVCILLYPKLFQKDSAGETLDSEDQLISQIAVLPFSNTRSNPETDYLGFAIADQIIGNLVYIKNITVRSSGAIRKYEQQINDPVKAGKELDVNYILSGNYLKEENIIRLNVELVDVEGNEMIWREPIEVEFTTAFELQDIVARKVMEGLNIQFSQTEISRIGKDIPKDPLAYEYYLRSISYPYTNDGDQLAINMLQKAIELDSGFAPAYAQMGDRLHRLAQYELLDPEETRRAERLYLKAISLNEDLIFGLANLAQIYTETERIEEAVRLIRKILDINPNNAEAHFSLGYIYRYAGMNQQAIEEMEEAVSIDPENQGFRSITLSYIYAGDYKKALKISKKYEASSFILATQGQAYMKLGNQKLADERFMLAMNTKREGLAELVAIGIRASIHGNIEEGMEAGHKFEEANILDCEAWFSFAGVYGLLGDKEGCVRCLQRAVERGFFNYPYLLTDSFLDVVRDDPRFHQVLSEARKKHLNFQKQFF